MALVDGDDDLCSVHIGRMFVRAEEDMMAAFKSYCTRQVWNTVHVDTNTG